MSAPQATTRQADTARQTGTGQQIAPAVQADSAPPTNAEPLEDRVRAELELIKGSVTGIYGSLVATSDGFLVAHDLPDLEPTEVAALVATTRALASRTTQATGRGDFMEALARGKLGYLAAYAAGSSAIVAVIGTNELNIGLLHIKTREIVARIAANTPEFRSWTSSAAKDQGRQAADEGQQSQEAPPPLPRRRASSR
jgi:uncharacterized protein